MNPVEKLKKIREDAGLSQAKLAKLLSIKEHVIKNVETGTQKLFPDELAYALEKEYGIPFKWWKTGEGEMFLACEDKEYLESLEAKAKELSISPDLLDLILEVTSQEPELMSFAAKSIRGDKAALERFYKLLS